MESRNAAMKGKVCDPSTGTKIINNNNNNLFTYIALI